MQGFQKLSVKIGLGIGPCSLLYVGGIFGRTQYLMVGEALRQALGSEGAIEKGGEIVASYKLWELLDNFFKGKEIANNPNYMKLLSIKGHGIASRNESFILLSNLDDDDRRRLKQQNITSYVPAAIRPYLEIDNENFGAETRRVSVMFASLSIQLGAAETEAGLHRIQKIVTTIQNAVYRFEGSLNKLVLDDKGSTLLCIWGLSPFAHQDDAIRAIQCGQYMRKELGRKSRPGDPDCQCNIGISTGVVFAGVLGSAGTRKQFSVFGDNVNLAARIMGRAKQLAAAQNQSLLFVDLPTKQAAERAVSIVFSEYKQFKGKSLRLPVYKPSYHNPGDEIKFAINKLDFVGRSNYSGVHQILKLHANPFLLNGNSPQMKGRQAQMEELKDQLLNFLEYPDQMIVLAIYGEIGSGKTLLALKVTQMLNYNVKLNGIHNGQAGLHIYASSLNSATELASFNSFRPILQAMLVTYSQRKRQKKAKLLRMMVRNHLLQQSELISQLLDLEYLQDLFNVEMAVGSSDDPLANGSTFSSPSTKTFSVPKVGRQKVPPEMKQALLQFILDFIGEYLDLQPDSASQSDRRSQFLGHTQQDKETEMLGGNTPLILIIDDVQRMDGPSWELLLRIQADMRRIAVILLWRTQFSGQPLIIPECAQQIHQKEDLRIEEVHVELQPLTRQELRLLFLDETLTTYYSSMRDEIAQRTDLENEPDPQPVAKGSKPKQSPAQEMMEQFQVYHPIRDIDAQILDILDQKCNNNPLLSLQFLYNLIVNNFVHCEGETQKQILVPSQLFIQARRIEDWTALPVPEMMASSNGSKIDEMGRVSEFKVQTTIIMKNASVIGDVFTTEQLMHMIPTHEQMLREQMFKILAEVESKLELIEEVDQNGPESLTYRFSRPFFRETLYQRLLFNNQKKFMHAQSASYIQKNPNADYDGEAECLRLTKHFLIAEDVNSEKELNTNTRQIILIKRLSNMLQKRTPVIKQGILTKQGERANQKIEHRYVVLTCRDLKYWHDEEESLHAPALGEIPLKHISNIMPANRMKSTSDFFIGAGSWKKKNEERDMREFVFGAENDQERDAWITAIMYLRTQAIQNDFNKKFNFLPNPNTPRTGNKDASQEKRMQDQSVFSFRTGATTSTLGSSPNPQQRRQSKFGGFPDKNRFSFVRQSTLSDQSREQEEVERVGQCLKQLFGFNFAHLLGHLSERSVNGGYNDRSFSKVPECIERQNIILFSSSVEMLADQIEKDNNQSSILSGPGNSSSERRIVERQTTVVRETHQRLSTSTIGGPGNSRHTITQEDFFNRSSSQPRSTLRRASTLMAKKDLTIDFGGGGGEDEEEPSLKLDDDDSDQEKTSPNHIPEEPSDEEEEQSEKEVNETPPNPTLFQKKLTAIHELPAPVSIILEQVIYIQDPFQKKERYLKCPEPQTLFEDVKSTNNGVKTQVRTNQPTVVFIEKVEKKRPPRLASSVMLNRIRTSPSTPLAKDFSRTPLQDQIHKGFLSLQGTPTHSMTPLPQQSRFQQIPQPLHGASMQQMLHYQSQLLNSVYSSTSSGFKPDQQMMMMFPSQTQLSDRRGSGLTYQIQTPKIEEKRVQDLSEISVVQNEKSNPLLETEDLSGFGQMLGVEKVKLIKAIAICPTRSIENPDFMIEDGDIFDIDREGAIFPTLGKRGMLQLKMEKKVGLFPLQHFKFSPPLQQILGPSYTPKLGPPVQIPEESEIIEEQKLVTVMGPSESKLTLGKPEMKALRDENSENVQDESEDQVNEPTDRFLQLPQVKFGSEKNSEVGSEENQTAFFDNNGTPAKNKKSPSPSNSPKGKKKGGIGKFLRPGKPPRSPQQNGKKKFLSPILTTSHSQQSSGQSRSSLTPKNNLAQSAQKEESKTSKKKGRIFKKNGSEKVTRFLKPNGTSSLRGQKQASQPIQRVMLEDPGEQQTEEIKEEEEKEQLPSDRQSGLRQWSQKDSQPNLMDMSYDSLGFHQPHISEPSPLQQSLEEPSPGRKGERQQIQEEASFYQSVGDRGDQKQGRLLKVNQRKKKAKT